MLAALGALVWEPVVELVVDGAEEEAVRLSVHVLFYLSQWDYRDNILLLSVMVLLLADVVAEVVDGAAVVVAEVVLVAIVVDSAVVEVVESAVVVAAVAVEAAVAGAVAPPRSWN